VRGRKIAGTGGTTEGAAFLFQGTLLVDLDVQTMLRALRVPMEKLNGHEIDSLRERVTPPATTSAASRSGRTMRIWC
jgi:lipoate-protein ligase A